MQEAITDYAALYDIWCAGEDERITELEKYLKDKTCMDCDECALPAHDLGLEYANHNDIGWCKFFEQFVKTTDNVVAINCIDYFEDRKES